MLTALVASTLIFSTGRYSSVTHRDHPDNDTFIPVYNIVITSVQQAGPDFTIVGKFRVSAKSGAYPGEKPKIYVSLGDKFQPNAQWYYVGDADKPQDPGDDSQWYVDVKMKLPTDFVNLFPAGTAPSGMLAVTLPGQAHGNKETSIAAVDFPTLYRQPAGLTNAIVPITMVPNSGSLGTRALVINGGPKKEEKIWINKGWETWKPWGIDGRPDVYELVRNTPVLGDGIWAAIDIKTDPDAGIWATPGNLDATIRFPSTKRSSLIICGDFSIVSVGGDAKYIFEYSGIIRPNT